MSIASLRDRLQIAREAASVAEFALQRAERRARDTAAELERMENCYPEALRAYVGRHRLPVLQAWSAAMGRLDRTLALGANLRKSIAAARSAETDKYVPEFAEEFRLFVQYAAEVALCLGKLRDQTSAVMSTVHVPLQRELDSLKAAGAEIFVRNNRALLRDASASLECSMDLLRNVPSCAQSELEWVSNQLERAEGEEEARNIRQQQLNSLADQHLEFRHTHERN